MSRSRSVNTESPTMLLLLLATMVPTASADTDFVARPGAPAESPRGPSRLDGSFDLTRALYAPSPADSLQQRRRRAIEYSEGFYRRLSIHRTMSYAMLPLFVGSYLTGTAQFDGEAPQWVRSIHKPLAIGTGVVFSVNTVTGILNLLESNKDSAGRTRRWVHGLAMIVADAGFAYAGVVLGPAAKRDPERRGAHRRVALGSIGLSVASWSFMLLTR